MNGPTQRHYRILSVLFVFGALWASSIVHAQDGKNVFDGKIITFLVGSSAGGGTDVTARLIARHIERYLPGKPRIDVANKPGAGGMIAANELYNLKKPDGLSISTLNTGALFATATGNEAIKFDLQRFLWVGQAFDDAQVLYLKTSTPYTSFDAIKKANREGKQPKMGAQALDHTSNVVVKIAEQIFGLDFTVIPGYPGTQQILLDIERGALDGRAQGIGSLMSTRREWIKNSYIKILATSKKRRDPRIPDVAPMEDIAPAGSNGLLQALYAGQNLARSVVLPPGVAADRVKIWRDAFAAMTKDEAFNKEAEKLGLEVDLIRGEEMNRDIENTLRDKRLMDLYRMIASAPLVQQGVDVQLPQAAAKTISAQQEHLTLSIKKDQKIFLNDMEVDPARLREKLEGIFSQRTDKELFLRADTELAYGFVIKVIAETKAAGVEKLGMVTVPPEGK